MRSRLNDPNDSNDDLCEHFAIRRLVQKEPIRISCQKIVNDENIFVRGQVAKAQHTLTYVSISLSADSCKKNQSELPAKKLSMIEEILC